MLSRDARRGAVAVWTRNGWVKKAIEAEQAERFSRLRSRINTSFENDFEGTRGEMDLIQDVQNEVMYGSPGLLIDQLPNALRNLMECGDTWHIVNTRLFRVSDPISQVHETGDWGTDQDDADLDVFSEAVSTSRMFLEEAGIIPSDSPATEVTDILGAVADGVEVPESPYFQRADIDIDAISIIPTEYDDGIEGEMLSISQDTDDVGGENEDTVVYRQYDGLMAQMPVLPDNVLARIHDIRAEYEQLISKARSENEKELVTLYYEQALDKAVNAHLTYPINSPFCAHRYQPPRRMHRFIPTPKDSEVSAAAEERVRFFYQLFGEAASCESMDDLHGPVSIDSRTTIDSLPNPNYGKKHRPGGFMGHIRSMYQHDKELALAWSIHDKVDKDGNLIRQSALNMAREKFIREWRENQKGDEEALRVALWVWFDREARDVAAVYDERTGRLISSAKKYKDSIWRQKRTKAFQDLFLTRMQWDAIYSMVEIIKQKLKIEFTTEPHERHQTMELLAEYFSKVTNLADLQSYERWASKRRISNGKVTPSKLDKISVLDEAKWKQSCVKKRRHLVGRLVLYNQLRAQVKSSKNTKMQDVALVCPDPKCNCMAIGQPVWYELEDNCGLLGVPCDGCGKVIWMLDHKETPVLKAYEE
jgi:hypothetical protein